MKKTYVTPDVEKVAFQYRDQVVVASGGSCEAHYTGVEDAVNGKCNFSHWTADNVPK